MMRTELTMDQMAQVNGGSYQETLEDEVTTVGIELWEVYGDVIKQINEE